MPEPTRQRVRPGLTRERVVAEALALADEGGTEALTMRRLGERLGVEAMSLYKHVANKEALLDGMVDAVFAEIEVPADVGWREAMRRRAVSVREAMRRHPWAITFMESRSSPGLATLRHHDAVLGVLRRDGFPVPLAAHAFAVLDAFIYGFTLTERSLPFDTPEDTAEVAASMFAAMPADELPHLTELTMQHVLQPGYDYADEYLRGLDLILEGLERALAGSSERSG